MVYKIWLFYFCILSTFLLGESYGFGRLFTPRTRLPTPRTRPSSPPRSPSLIQTGVESGASSIGEHIGEHIGEKVAESMSPRSEESNERSESSYSNQPNRLPPWGAGEEPRESPWPRYNNWNYWPNRYSSWEAPYSNGFMPGPWNPYGGGPGYYMGR